MTPVLPPCLDDKQRDLTPTLPILLPYEQNDLTLIPVTGHNRGVASVAFSPDGQTLVSGRWDKSIKLWEVASGRQTAVLDGHTWAVRFSPDGKSLASAGKHKTIKLWDIASGKNTANLNGNVTDVLCLAYHPDGKTLASASGESGIKLWDTATGKNFAALRQDFGFRGHHSQLQCSRLGSAASGSERKRLIPVPGGRDFLAGCTAPSPVSRPS
jgi:WD40 repeat protein